MAEKRLSREERKENREQEALFRALDKMDEGQYQNFVEAFRSNPESILSLAFPRMQSMPENAVAITREYIETDARNQRKYGRALEEIAKDVKPLAKTLAACKAGTLDPDVCEAAHDVLGELNKIVTPAATNEFDGRNR